MSSKRNITATRADSSRHKVGGQALVGRAPLTQNDNGDQTNGLPPGWVLAKLTDFVWLNPPKPDLSNYRDDMQVSFVPMAAVSEVTASIASPQLRQLSQVKKGYTPFKEGDVIFAKITPCMENGKVAITESLKNGFGFGSTEFHVLRPFMGVPPKYVHRFVLQNNFRNEARQAMTGTAGQLRVPERFMADAEIPVAPLPEQHRIVEKLEALLERVEKAKASIENVPKLLKQFRQAILGAACSGKLVEQHSNDEPASELLKRIRAERRKKWEEELLAKGKEPNKYEYEEPTQPDTSELPELPSGWAWASVGLLLEFMQYGSSVKADADKRTGTPILRMGNIQDGFLNFQNLKYVDPKKEDTVKYLLKNGDILINRTNSPELVGKAAVFEREGKYIFASYLIRLIPFRESVLPKYAVSWINSVFGRRHVGEVKHQVAGQANINTDDIRTMPIALPPFAEQHRIVAKAEELFRLADTIEASVEKARSRSEKIKQSLLAKAFRGELVEQDPNDPPASVLLEQIKLQKEKLKAQNQSKAKPKRTRRGTSVDR